MSTLSKRDCAICVVDAVRECDVARTELELAGKVEEAATALITKVPKKVVGGNKNGAKKVTAQYISLNARLLDELQERGVDFALLQQYGFSFEQSAAAGDQRINWTAVADEFDAARQDFAQKTLRAYRELQKEAKKARHQIIEADSDKNTPNLEPDEHRQFKYTDRVVLDEFLRKGFEKAGILPSKLQRVDLLEILPGDDRDLLNLETIKEAALSSYIAACSKECNGKPNSSWAQITIEHSKKVPEDLRDIFTTYMARQSGSSRVAEK